MRIEITESDIQSMCAILTRAFAGRHFSVDERNRYVICGESAPPEVVQILGRGIKFIMNMPDPTGKAEQYEILTESEWVQRPKAVIPCAPAGPEYFDEEYYKPGSPKSTFAATKRGETQPIKRLWGLDGGLDRVGMPDCVSIWPRQNILWTL